MSTLRQLKRRISSIEKIVKITQAMEIVSLFRLKKVENKALARKAYFESLSSVVFFITKRLKPPHKPLSEPIHRTRGFSSFLKEKKKEGL